MQVIQHVDSTGLTMVSRWPQQGTSAIELGSQLIVEESQKAVFFRDGKALDTFDPGRHTLATQNLPFLTKLLGLPFEGKSPFQAAVAFVSTKTFLDLKWGTKEPVVYRDSELAMIRLRAFGKFAVRIDNPQVFVNTIVGTMGLYTTDGVEAYFKDVIVARLTDLLGENLKSIFDLPKVYDELSMGLKARVSEDFGKYGIELVDLFLGAITPPKDVQKLVDERGGMEAVGDMNAYMKFKAAQAMGDAAKQGGEGGGNVGAGLGVGMGAGMGMMLPQMMKEAMQDPGGQSGQGGPSSRGEHSGDTSSQSRAASGATQAANSASGGSPGEAEGQSSDTSHSETLAPEDGVVAFCHQCGDKLPGQARFCPKCGTKVGG